MRITHKIATAASTALARFPVPKVPADNFTLPGGGLDHDRIRAALKGEEFTHSSSDNEVVYAFALEYIRNLDTSLTKLRMDDPQKSGQAKADARASARCGSRMDRGQFAICRVDIEWKGDGLRVRINVANPRGVVGESEASACDFAELAARVLDYIASQLTARGVKIELIDGPDVPCIFARAKMMNDWCAECERLKPIIEKMNAKRMNCANRRGQYCTPSVPCCDCYKDGRCVPLALPPRPDVDANLKSLKIEVK